MPQYIPLKQLVQDYPIALTVSQVRNWLEEKKGLIGKKVVGKWYVRKDDLDRFINNRTSSSPHSEVSPPPNKGRCITGQTLTA